MGSLEMFSLRVKRLHLTSQSSSGDVGTDAAVRLTGSRFEDARQRRPVIHNGRELAERRCAWRRIERWPNGRNM